MWTIEHSTMGYRRGKEWAPLMVPDGDPHRQRPSTRPCRPS
jgi:hypothetical protein